MGLRGNEDAEIKDLINRIKLECPRSGEGLEAFEKRVGSASGNDSASAGMVLTSRGFGEIPISRRTLKGLKEAEYKFMTPIQRYAIPYALSGLDVLGEAKTGSGKTVSFCVPVIECLYRNKWSKEDGLGALIISPTRELAAQIFNVVKTVGRFHELSAGCVVGGRDFKQEQKVFGSMAIIVATPGRLLQHFEESPDCDASNLAILVLDEADRILDMGFADTVKSLLSYFPPKRQTLLFSATLRTNVQNLAQLALNKPEIISMSRNSLLPSKLKQFAMVVPIEKKIDALYSFVRSHASKKLIVFVSSCKQVRFISEAFKRLKVGPAVLDLQGKQSLEKRMHTFENFGNRESSVCLICTDVAARGVDFPQVDWVIQLDLPEDADNYLHRIGRTARFESSGSSLAFILPEEQDAFFEELGKKQVPLPNIVSPNKSKLVSIKGKLQPMLSKDADLKHIASRSFVSYIKALHMTRRVAGKVLNFDGFSESMGLAVTPEYFLPEIAQKTDKAVSKLQKLKEKIKAKKEEKRKARATDDGWSDDMREDAEESYGKKTSKAERKAARSQRVSGKKEEEEEEEDLLVKTVKTPEDQIPISFAEERAEAALARQRVKIRKDGTMYVRGAGALGKPQGPVFFNDHEEDEPTSNDLPSNDSAEQSAYIEQVRARLAERSAEDAAREKQRIKDKHSKIRAKLRGKRKDEDGLEDEPSIKRSRASEDGYQTADSGDEEVDIAALEQAYKAMRK